MAAVHFIMIHAFSYIYNFFFISTFIKLHDKIVIYDGSVYDLEKWWIDELNRLA